MIRCNDVTKMPDCALGIVGALHAPVDVKQQIELSLDTIVSGSQLALKSAHFYSCAAIRQLEIRTIERDCTTTLAAALKK